MIDEEELRQPKSFGAWLLQVPFGWWFVVFASVAVTIGWWLASTTWQAVTDPVNTTTRETATQDRVILVADDLVAEPSQKGPLAAPRASESEAEAPRPDPDEGALSGSAREGAISGSADVVNEDLSTEGWVIPVVGVAPNELQGSFNDPRSGGRLHRAIDIPAPRHRPVVAALDGKIVRLSETPRGGLSIHLRSAAGRHVLFYAHLESIDESLTEGMIVQRGTKLGTVGNSGNAEATSPHLHFAVSALGANQRWWRGEPIDPYSLLLRAETMPLLP